MFHLWGDNPVESALRTPYDMHFVSDIHRMLGINVGAVAAYSALEYYVENNATVLVVVWEQSPRILSYRLPVDDWCPEKAP